MTDSRTDWQREKDEARRTTPKPNPKAVAALFQAVREWKSVGSLLPAYTGNVFPS